MPDETKSDATTKSLCLRCYGSGSWMTATDGGECPDCAGFGYISAPAPQPPGVARRVDGNLYAERDSESQGEWFMRHLDHMTTEKLFLKTAIAAELAHRDMEIARLRKAIHNHRDQKADDRCVEDDDRLYETLGDGIKCDRRVGNKAEMLANYHRFIERRCEAGGPWPTYAQLEQKVMQLQEQIKQLQDVSNPPSMP